MPKQTITMKKENSFPKIGVVLCSPVFLAHWLSESFSLNSDGLVGVISHVYGRTSLEEAEGLLMILKAMIAMVMSSVTGVFVKRWSRKWIMVIANLLQMFLVNWHFKNTNWMRFVPCFS